MKIEKFLNWILDKMLNYPDVSISTVKMFIDKFHFYLSKKQKEQFSLKIQLIREFTCQQLSLESFVHNSKVEILENELNNLKEVDDNTIINKK